MTNDYKKILMATSLAVMSLCATAADVDVLQAQARAAAFLNTRPAVGISVVHYGAPLQLLHAEPSTVSPAVMDYYVFAGQDRFVIVSGEDRAQPVLAYGDSRPDMDNLPCGMQWLLNHYKEQIEWLRAHPGVATQEPSYAPGRGIDPLLTVNWSQGTPYNDQCPEYKGQRCVTGCIATAMAQVMYYWQYPDSLPSYPAYTTGAVNVSPLPGARLNWDEMLDGYENKDFLAPVRYTQAQGEAVATLMRYCGQATKMAYGVDGSGSGSWNQMNAMTDMGYNTASRNLHRDDYSASDWKSMMVTELTAGRPILYCGHSEEGGGHAFVVDGYDGRAFHINWGWEGSANAYFYLDAFSAYGYYGFNYNQSMLLDVYPTRYALPYDVEADGICYRRTGNELTVTRKAERDNTYSGTVTIPAHVMVDGVDCVVTAIGNSAFKNCKSLKSVTLPETIKRIGKYAFKGCIALTSMTLPNKLEDIGFAAFQDCVAIQSFKFGTGLRHISTYAFYNCTGLEQVNLPHTVQSIEPHGFLLCPKLKALTIDMECVPDEAFYYCRVLKTVTLGNHVKTIGQGAFLDCWSITDVAMGANVDSIAPHAFTGCTALTSIKRLPEAPPLVADVNSFDERNYSQATLYVPEASRWDYFSCDVWTLFEHQEIESPVMPGDVNLDGAVNIGDVNLVINDILAGTMSLDCDVNGDGTVNITDVNAIINHIIQ